jgi:hypothetical protein
VAGAATVVLDEPVRLLRVELRHHRLRNVQRVGRERVVPEVLPDERLLKFGVRQIDGNLSPIFC